MTRIRTVVMCAVAVLALTTAGCADQSQVRQQDANSVAEAPMRGQAAGTFLELDLPGSIASADLIVLGSVARELPSRRGLAVSTEARARLKSMGRSDAEIDSQAQEFRDWVYTPSVFQIEQVLKGEFSQATVEIRNVGGSADGVTLKSDDFPQVAGGGQRIVFLGTTWDGTYEPLAVYRVQSGMASTRDQGRKENMPVDELLATIEKHRNDPSPFKAAE